MKRLLVTLALATVALVAAACSGTNAGNPPTGVPSAGPVDPNAPVVTARDLEFGQAEVVVVAGKSFKLTFTNLESAPHNVAIYRDASARDPISVGEIFGNGTKVQDVPALDAGSYFFRCDVHPDMQGVIVAK